ncbi:hypothetical protein AXK60_14540 [Tsukamurella pseudospumae]|uniref:Uncharacterized protein n=1 Tax=Tsukamurella pseudospumae TaxID=239498 RepID=A0A137ZY50_9ACTN|nr:hypothetical protein AXK60_14540 [Tsukamurella pseudospumae]
MQLALAAHLLGRRCLRFGGGGGPSAPVLVAGWARGRRDASATAAPGPDGALDLVRGERLGGLAGRPVLSGLRSRSLDAGGAGLGRRCALPGATVRLLTLLRRRYGPSALRWAGDALGVPGRAGARVALGHLRPGEVRLVPVPAARSFVVHVVRLYGP